MPRIQILNPNDQPTGKWRLINELRSCLVSDDYQILLMAVAFAKSGPLLRLKAEIEVWLAKGKKIASIFGVNHRNTSKQALQFALEHFTTARILFHSDDFTFHPKMYLFIGPQKCRFFIGSHNLTVGGTETNWESGTEVRLNLPEDKAMLAETMEVWESLLAFSAQLTPQLIHEYEVFGKLADETEQRKRPALPRPLGENAAPSQGAPPRLKLKIKPPSPLPKGLFTKRVPETFAKTKLGAIRKGIPTKVTAEALVIQIAPHHNGEVFLSKIAVDQNPNFFGFPFTGQTKSKKPSNPSYPQRDPDPIVNLRIYGDGPYPAIHIPRLALNTVYYTKKSEIRITVPPEVVKNTPDLSILVMRQALADSDLDYEMEVFPPSNPQFQDYLAVCNQTMPSGGRTNPRRMGWL